MKKTRITTASIAAITITIVCLSFSGNEKAALPDLNRLAAQYFQEDAQWYVKNIPFFECSDKQIEEVYYYRWKLYKAHIRKVGPPYHYVVTEFIDDVDWDLEPYSTINLPSGHHIYEGRWLRNNAFLDGYTAYLNCGGGNNLHYSENIADATWQRYLINADSGFVANQLPCLQQNFNGWDGHFDKTKGLYYIEPIHDGAEYSISAIDACGGINGTFGGEPYLTEGEMLYERGAKEAFMAGRSFRPTINSYMAANAQAIGNIASLTGNNSMAQEYRQKAENIKSSLLNGLWNSSDGHFEDRYKESNGLVQYWDFISGRELSGFVPWAFNLPGDNENYTRAWERITDQDGFKGKYGLRTVEPSYPYYMKQVKFRDGRADCQWNGPSWPFQTSQALMAVANLLNNYHQEIINISDYVQELRKYTRQHYYNNGDTYILNLQEDYNPDTGKPITYQRDYGSDHYNHSTYNDLVITGLCGLRPSQGDILTINPLVDSSINYFCLDGVLYHGHNLTLVYDADGSKYRLGKGLTVFVDGKKTPIKEKNGKYEVEIGKPVVIKAPAVPENLALNILYKGYPKPSASVNNIPDSLFKAVDGRIWNFPEVSNRWTTLGSTSETDWYAIDFGKAQAVSSVKLYLYADGKTYGAPDQFTVEYLKDGQWLPVKVKERRPEKSVGNTVNSVVFDKVSATKMRINFKNEQATRFAIAVAELECY